MNRPRIWKFIGSFWRKMEHPEMMLGQSLVNPKFIVAFESLFTCFVNVFRFLRAPSIGTNRKNIFQHFHSQKFNKALFKMF